MHKTIFCSCPCHIIFNFIFPYKQEIHITVFFWLKNFPSGNFFVLSFLCFPSVCRCDAHSFSHSWIAIINIIKICLLVLSSPSSCVRRTARPCWWRSVSSPCTWRSSRTRQGSRAWHSQNQNLWFCWLEMRWEKSLTHLVIPTRYHRPSWGF